MQSSTGKPQTDPFAPPAPTPEALDLSRRLIDVVVDRIEQRGGFLPFSDYMETVLYQPGLGYYVNGTIKFGAAGDFVTAPGVSELFGATLARWLRPILREDATEILEFGAGQGTLAADILAACEAQESPPLRYRILEPSPVLQAVQRERLEQSLSPDAFRRCAWLQSLPTALSRVIVLANEVVDAMPVEAFRWFSSGVTQLGVGKGPGGLVILERPAPESLAEYVRVLEKRHGPWPDGYRSEARMLAGPWLQTLSEAMGSGLVILSDYGYPGAEYYRAERSMGTLQGHYRHRVVHDPLQYPGLGDLTASVDFTALAEAASDAGLDVLGYAAQGEFLLASGLPDLFAERTARLANEPRKTLELARQVRQLTLPGEMGERFQLMILGKRMTLPPSGFRDRRERL